MKSNKGFFASAAAMLMLATYLPAVFASSGGQFDFLLRFHPKVSTSMIVTGPEHVERVTLHSLVFSPKQAHNVLPELNKVLMKRHGWTKTEAQPQEHPGEYVVFEHGATSVVYMSERVYRQLIRPDGTKLLPTEKGGCVVEYCSLNRAN